jgi:hypothetical protein
MVGSVSARRTGAASGLYGLAVAEAIAPRRARTPSQNRHSSRKRLSKQGKTTDLTVDAWRRRN